MGIEEALRVADTAADRNTPAAEHPSLMNMIDALEVLANDYRIFREKAAGWEKSYRSQTYAHDQMAVKLRKARDDMQKLNERREQARNERDAVQVELGDLLECLRPAVGAAVIAGPVDMGAVRSALGQVFADARLLARIRDEVSGKFVAGSVVTAAEPAKPSPRGYTTRFQDGQVWSAPAGTDPADWYKWTCIGSATDFTVAPARQAFPAGSPEPSSRVKRVARAGGSATFTRVACTVDGQSLWCEDTERDSAPLWLWAHLVRHHGVEEIS